MPLLSAVSLPRLSKTAVALLALAPVLSAQAMDVYPPNWWAGMHSSKLQLMVHDNGIGAASVSTSYPGVSITSVIPGDSKNYLFVDLEINDANPGTVPLTFTVNGTSHTVDYRLEKRRTDSAQREGFSPSDAIYLITPDRFANGDKQNDSIDGLADKLDRDAPGGRHGGDIQGMIDHLDYIKDMGFTQIWSMPLLENAMDSYSYHGYAITDFYQVDPRYGSNALYQTLSKKAADKGMGLIMDMVLNHIGSQSPWMADMPFNNWIHHGTEFVQTTHRREALHDPHGAKSDISAFADGWFVPTMPDLNQSNPYLATYLIQNAVWWVEFANLSGIRVDTYSYSDKTFLSAWTTRLMQEYPHLNIVGEEWSTNPIITSYWQAGTPRRDNYVSALPSVMDFPLQDAIHRGLKQSETWATGLRSIYETLASDFVYGDPYNLVVFADNHDMSRIFTQMDENLDAWNMAMTLVLTTRGIPQVFYGTEILMANPGTDDHGIIRSDFPGGFAGDSVNAFTGKGLSKNQHWAQQRLRSLLHLRQQVPALGNGKLIQYAPVDGLYVYFRLPVAPSDEIVMVALNKRDSSASLTLADYAETTGSVAHAMPLDGQYQPVAGALEVPAHGAKVWVLKP